MLTKKEIEHIAELARMKLTEREKEKIAKDLGVILEYVAKLETVDTNTVAPTAQVTGQYNVVRPDGEGEVIHGEEREKLIGQSPQRKNNYVKVRAVLE